MENNLYLLLLAIEYIKNNNKNNNNNNNNNNNLNYYNNLNINYNNLNINYNFNNKKNNKNCCRFKYCGKKFKDCSTRTRHEKIHLNLIFKCRYCYKIYNRKDNLIRHEKNCK